MRLEHHLVGGYVRYISPHIIIIILIILINYFIWNDFILEKTGIFMWNLAKNVRQQHKQTKYVTMCCIKNVMKLSQVGFMINLLNTWGLKMMYLLITSYWGNYSYKMKLCPHQVDTTIPFFIGSDETHAHLCQPRHPNGGGRLRPSEGHPEWRWPGGHQGGRAQPHGPLQGQ